MVVSVLLSFFLLTVHKTVAQLSQNVFELIVYSIEIFSAHSLMYIEEVDSLEGCSRVYENVCQLVEKFRRWLRTFLKILQFFSQGFSGSLQQYRRFGRLRGSPWIVFLCRLWQRSWWIVEYNPMEPKTTTQKRLYSRLAGLSYCGKVLTAQLGAFVIASRKSQWKWFIVSFFYAAIETAYDAVCNKDRPCSQSLPPSLTIAISTNSGRSSKRFRLRVGRMGNGIKRLCGLALVLI